MVDLGRQIASLALIRGDYELATAIVGSRRPERPSAWGTTRWRPTTCAQGIAGFYQGRQWQARALPRARASRRRGRAFENLFRVLSMLPSFIGARRPSRRARRRARSDRARPAGGQPERRDQRSCSTPSRMHAGPATGTGRVRSSRPRGSSRSTSRRSSATGLQELFFRIFSGTPRRADIDDLDGRSTTIDDTDVRAGLSTPRRSIAYRAGRWADAGPHGPDHGGERPQRPLRVARRPAARRASRPRSGGCRAALDRLAALGARGRAIEADRAAIRAGMAALEGDLAGAGLPTARPSPRFVTSGLVWDEALVGIEAAVLLGTADAEIGGWADTSREILAALGATPVLARLDDVHRAGRRRDPAAPSRPPARRRRGSSLGQRRDRRPTAQPRACEPGHHVPAEGLDHPRVPDVAGAEDHVLAPASESSPNQSTIWAGVSPRPAVGLELHGLERRALDLGGVAADRLAVLAQDLVLVVDPHRAAEHVARVGVLRHEAERLPLAAAPDHDRRIGAA